jgi:L-asparaginase II/GNAT superfamily N-acetyltransferase
VTFGSDVRDGARGGTPDGARKAGSGLARAAEAWEARLEPLVAVTRGDSVESVHRGVVVVADADGRVLGGVGDPETPVLLRSAAKPFQAVPLVTSGVADTLGLTDQELAVVCASHSGRPEHVAAVSSILTRSGLIADALVCGPQFPFDPEARRLLEAAGESPSALHNTCSGKHAGMLALAGALGVEPAGYERRGHRVQQAIREAVAMLLGRDGAGLWDGTDGCGVPVFQMSAREAATLYALLAEGRHEALARLCRAMMDHPAMVGGTGSLDTAVMRALPGGVVAKGGADGVQGLGFSTTGKRSAVGCLIKIGDGAGRPLRSVVGGVLSSLGEDRAAATLLGEDAGTLFSKAGAAVGALIPLMSVGDLLRSSDRGTTRAAAREKDPAGGEPGKPTVRLTVGSGSEREVVRFLREQWGRADEEILGRRFDWRVERLVLIARDRRDVVGVLRGHIVGGVAAVDELIVREDRRGRGIGSRLLAGFEQEARLLGGHKCTLRTPRGARAEGFYRSRGYVREHLITEHHFGFDFVGMAKTL